MEAAEVNAVELGQQSGLGRAIIGRYARGETQAMPAEHANLLAPILGVRMSVFLTDGLGYHLPLTARDRVDIRLEALWPHLSAEVRQGLLALAQAAATPGEAEGEPAA